MREHFEKDDRTTKQLNEIFKLMRDDDEPIKRQRIYATKIVDALEGHAEEACDVLKVPRKRSRDEEEVCSCYGYTVCEDLKSL